MKFAEHLSAHITPEWRKQYIQYEVTNKHLLAKSFVDGFCYVLINNTGSDHNMLQIAGRITVTYEPMNRKVVFSLSRKL